MKKNFEQPELMVVQMNNRDIVTESITRGSDISTGMAGGADRFRDFEDYSY